MDVQTVNVAVQEVQPPPGGRSSGKGLPLMGATDTQAAFQSLMASLMAPLLAIQSPQALTAQPVAGDAQASMLSTVTQAAQGQALTTLAGQDVLSATQGTGAKSAVSTAPASDVMSMLTSAPQGDAKTTAPLQTLAQQPLPVDNAATLDALRALASGQAPGAATAEGAVATATQASTANPLASQVLAAEGGEQTGKPATSKAESTTVQTQFAGFTATVNAGESVTGAGTVKAANASPVQQIAEQVQMTLNRGENSATIRLQPAELGGVRIRLQVQDGQVHLSIEAEKSGTSRLIDQQIGSLRQNLENSGVRVGDLAVLAGGRGHVAGVEAMQREAAQSLRTMQMEMSSHNFQQQQHAHQQQAAFAGQDGQPRQRGQFDPAQTLDGSRPNGVASVNVAGLSSRNVWQSAAYAAVDYYA